MLSVTIFILYNLMLIKTKRGRMCFFKLYICIHIRKYKGSIKDIDLYYRNYILVNLLRISIQYMDNYINRLLRIIDISKWIQVRK